jgi:hypothetical protein
VITFNGASLACLVQASSWSDTRNLESFLQAQATLLIEQFGEPATGSREWLQVQPHQPLSLRDDNGQ